MSIEHLESVLFGSDMNYWEDEGLSEVLPQTRALPQGDWETLIRRALAGTEEHQLRLAQLCGGIDVKRALPVLLQLLASAHVEVAEYAADSLRSHTNTFWRVATPEHCRALEKLAKGSGIGAAVARDLLRSKA